MTIEHHLTRSILSGIDITAPFRLIIPILGGVFECFGSSDIPGISVIAAHKNTPFSFLKELRTGDLIIVQGTDGQSHNFIMTAAEIVHKDNSRIPKHQILNQSPKIALVTCYPFDTLNFGGPMRYVVYGDLQN